jgi:hypothetical protein
MVALCISLPGVGATTLVLKDNTEADGARNAEDYFCSTSLIEQTLFHIAHLPCNDKLHKKKSEPIP